MVARIDEIRPDLGSRGVVTSPAQGGKKPYGHGGLTYARMSTRNHDAGAKDAVAHGPSLPQRGGYGGAMVGLQIRARAALPPRRQMKPSSEGLLLVAHGSRCALATEQLASLVGLVAAASPDLDVELGFLELTEPPAGPMLERLLARGCRRVVVLPLVLLAAGHAKSDVPALVVEARARHPEAEIVLGRPLGVSRQPVEILGKAVVAAGGHGLPLLVVARGTSDPDANGDAFKAARLVAEWTAAPIVQVGYSGVTRPSVVEAASLLARLGNRRFALAWWYLCHGALVERGRSELADFCEEADVEIVDAGYLGPHPALVSLVAERWQEAIGGRVERPCDNCAYRAPWPGLEQRVAQPIGVGHSHLAAEHGRRGHQMIREQIPS
jgi:sirohydrochlorin cobaltochelatase